MTLGPETGHVTKEKWFIGRRSLKDFFYIGQIQTVALIFDAHISLTFNTHIKCHLLVFASSTPETSKG